MSTANPARKLVADLLRTAQTSWSVIDEVRAPDAVDRPTALVYTSEIVRSSAGRGGYLQSTVTVWCFPTQDAKGFEDRADQVFSDVVDAIEPQDAVTWAKAERGVLGTLQGWKLTLAVGHRITTTVTP
jgi:hypothetical protein